MLGRYITGFAPGFGSWLFAAFVGAAVCGGYVLLGATWLVLKTDGELQKKAVAWAKWGLLWVALGVTLISLATPLTSETVRSKWFAFPNIILLSPLPIGTLLCGILLWRSLGKSEWQPFAFTVAIYVLSFAGLAYSIFPYVVMDRLTIWEAAAHESALKFMLVGALIVLPFLVGYTIYSYRVFGGKARAGLYE
jgi:cytochrome d ubiquinol oxidase subunit II